MSASSYGPRLDPVRILLLGDCTVATAYLPDHLRSDAQLAAALRAHYPHEDVAVVNEGLDGETAATFLRRYDRALARAGIPDYVLMRYGPRDRKTDGVDAFATRLHELITRLRADFPLVRILLETSMYVDYPRHYEFDRNAVLQPVYDRIRQVGRELGLPVVDIYERMRRETEAGNWDLRVRGYGAVDEDIPVFGASQDHLYGDDVRWFTNIHPSPRGVAVIADEEARTIALHWPDTLRSTTQYEA